MIRIDICECKENRKRWRWMCRRRGGENSSEVKRKVG